MVERSGAYKPIKISVIVPVYNVENDLGTAIESVLQQTLQDIELICVDDGSTDGSLAVLQAAAERDPRVHIVRHETNQGILAARQSGVRQAEGKYILFLDADDLLYPEACATVWEQMEETQADVLLFHTDVTAVLPVMEKEAAELEASLNRHKNNDVLRGELALRCLKEKEFTYTVWNKAYRAQLCKSALGAVRLSSPLVVSEDMLFSLIVLYRAGSLALCNSVLYRYRFGSGVTGKARYSAADYRKLCRSKDAYDEAERFLQQVDAPSDYFETVQQLRTEALEWLTELWLNRVSKSGAEEAWDYLTEDWGAAETVSTLAKHHFSEAYRIIDLLDPAIQKTAKEKPVKHVGVFYYRMTNGGVERVTSTIVPKWLEKGYKVTLLTEQPATPKDYPMPAEVERVLITPEANAYGENYAARAAAWEKAITEGQIDTVVHEAYFSPLLAWDALMLRSMGVNLVLWSHNLYSMLFRQLSIYTYPTVAAYRLADRVVVLSTVFAQFWNSFAPSVYIPNPIHVQPEPSTVDGEKKNVLWVGRFSPEKRPDEVLEAFSLVAATVPEARFTIVGKGETEQEDLRLREEAKRLGIGDRVHFAGFHTDVTPFYRDASLFVMTSVYEGYPLVLSESKCFGVPIVMYDLPYLAQVMDHRGVVTVPQQDVASLAEQVTALLRQEDKRKALSEAAYQAAVDAAGYDFAAAWDELFSGFGRPVPAEQTAAPLQQMMLSQLMQDMRHGVIYNGGTFSWETAEWENRLARTVDRQIIEMDQQRALCNAQCNAFDRTIKEIYGSTMFKAGQAVTWLPRMLKNIVLKLMRPSKGAPQEAETAQEDGDVVEEMV